MNSLPFSPALLTAQQPDSQQPDSQPLVSLRKEQIRRAFGRAAPTYDQSNRVQGEVACQTAFRLPQRSFDTILEIGCGTGNYTTQLRQRYPQAQITALDLSAEMIAAAQSKFASDAQLIRWIVADGEAYRPSSQVTFDLVTSSGTFQWFEALPRTLQRYHRMLADGGLLAFSAFGPQTYAELQQVWQSSLPAAGPLPAAGFADADRLREWLGCFSAIQVDQVMLNRPESSLLALLRTIRGTGTGGSIPSQAGNSGTVRSGLLTPATIRRLDEVYRHRYGGIPVTYEVFFCQAFK